MARLSTNETKPSSIPTEERSRTDVGASGVKIHGPSGAPSPSQNRPTATSEPLAPREKLAQRHVEILSVAAQHFANQLDFRMLLGDVAQQGHLLLPVDQVLVYSNLEGHLCPEVSFPQRKPLARDVSADAQWCARYQKPKVNHQPTDLPSDIRNCLSVPFVAAQNRVLGVVEFRNKKTGGLFTEEDTRAATCLARIATIGLDRARLFFRIEEWRRSVETLLSFNATVNQQLEPENMVRELVSNVTGFLDAEGGMAGIVIRADSEPGSQSQTAPTDGVQCDGFYFGDLWSNFARRWAPGERIPGTVLQTQFPYLSRDYNSDPLREPDLCEAFDLGSCICVPIKNPQEEVLGFFQLHRRTGEPEFTWQDAAFLESLGNTAAVAIQNARLVKSLELKTDQIKSLSQDHVRRLEEERRHIARELHDETGQVLIGLKLRLQILSGLLNEEQSDAKTELRELRQQVNDAAVQLKDMAKRLRPPTLDELGFEATLRELVTEFRRHANFAILLEIKSAPRLSNDEETALYRIVQECLTNVAKHANADRVEIVFSEHAGRQVLRIEDNGKGFLIDESSHGLGHVGIRERVAMLGGQIHVVSLPGQGTSIEVHLREANEA